MFVNIYSLIYSYSYKTLKIASARMCWQGGPPNGDPGSEIPKDCHTSKTVCSNNTKNGFTSYSCEAKSFLSNAKAGECKTVGKNKICNCITDNCNHPYASLADREQGLLIDLLNVSNYTS